MIGILTYAEALMEAGVAENRAKAHARAMRNHVLPDLATKQDISDMRSEVRTELQGLRSLVEQRFAETHQRIWQATLAAVLGTAALVGLVLRFLP